MILQLIELLRQTQGDNSRLEHQLQQLLKRLYGRSAEKSDPNQQVLFAELLQQLQPTPPEAPPQVPPAAPTRPAASPSPNGHGRRRLPADLPREQVVLDLPEDQKLCPCCGQMRCVIGQEVSEKLDYVPARIKVIQTVRPKYACQHCDQQAKGAQIAIADLPSSPIDKGLAAPGLLAYVIVSKYSDHLPLHRLERILERHGIDIARSTMCDWAAQCAGLLGPLYDLMVREVLASQVIHTDDTPVDVLDKKLNQTRTGRFWVYSGDGAHPQDVFDFTPSRSRDGPTKFLTGWGKEQRVYLQADAFGGYDGIYRGEAGGQVVEVACSAHARRKFHEARTSDAAGSARALAYIRLLYDVEDQAKAQFEAQDLDRPCRGLHDIRLELRQKLARPRRDEFKLWLESQQAASGGPVLPKSPMGQAITYALNQWEALGVYITDGRLNIDNNVSERALRRVAIGRNNWLFCGSDNGGDTAAVFFTLIATCQRHAVNCFDYLRDVLTRLPSSPVSHLGEFLPDRWAQAQRPPAPPAPLQP